MEDRVIEYSELTVERRFFEEIARRRESPGEIVMVVRRPGRRVLVMTKGFYPEGVYRLPTGKMRPGETPDAGFSRELCEETGFDSLSGRLVYEIRYTLRSGDETAAYTSFVMLTDETPDEPTPIDEDEGITGFREVTPAELRLIAEELRGLDHPWHDWGRYRAVAHDLVSRLLTDQ